MEKTTATASAKSKKRLPLIENYRDEVKDSASIDLEWIPYTGRYQHNKTKIFAACFCTNYGDRIVLHISRYSNDANPEKAIIIDILFYLNQFPLTFGWYTAGIVEYDNKGHRSKGRDSDFYVLHQRCKLHCIKSPFEVRDGYVRLLDTGSIKNKKIHIDLIKIFEKPIIQNGVFQSKFRTTSLDAVSVSLLGVGKYNSMSAGTVDITKVPIQEQERYVRRDAELTMLLAQYNDCLALRIMKVFSKYAEMDYYKVCYTNVSSWYTNRYDKMIQSGEVTIENTPDYTLPKERIGGGHHTTPTSGFFVANKVYELDIKGQYPSIVIINNFSFDTLNCRCCMYNPKAQLNPATIKIINQHLQQNKIPRKVTRYWVCQKRKGAFPKLLEQVLSDRDKYLVLLREELAKEEPNRMLIEEYQTHQLGAKLFANAGFGLFGNKYFKYTNYKVAECITGEGRRVHKQMEQKGQDAPYNFAIVFGFTDSTFFKDASENKVKEFIAYCKNRLGYIVELKNVFLNSIFYAKKNRYVAWTGLEKDSVGSILV